MVPVATSVLAGPTSLLDLPEGVQREVLSWCPDVATADALLNTCRAQHRLRSDPSAAALLLLRLRCGFVAEEYGTLLDLTFGCEGGEAAVLHHIVHRLQPCTLECGRPFTAPAALLQAMLYSAAAANDGAAIRSLLALPHPPDVDGHESCAVRLAFPEDRETPPFSALQALVDCGASPHPTEFQYQLIRASGPIACVPALRLLLPLCPNVWWITIHNCMTYAIPNGNKDAVALLLPTFRAVAQAQPGNPSELFRLAAEHRHPQITRLLIDGAWADMADLQRAFYAAVQYGQVESVTMLLDHGVDVNQDEGGHGRGHVPLAIAMSLSGKAEAVHQEAMVRLLLRHGAVVTEGVWFWAGIHRADPGVVALLQAAVPAECLLP